METLINFFALRPTFTHFGLKVVWYIYLLSTVVHIYGGISGISRVLTQRGDRHGSVVIAECYSFGPWINCATSLSEAASGGSRHYHFDLAQGDLIFARKRLTAPTHRCGRHQALQPDPRDLLADRGVQHRGLAQICPRCVVEDHGNTA